MNDYQFRYLLEQLQKQEEETGRLDQRIDDLTNGMKIMARSIKTLTRKLDKLGSEQVQPRKKRKLPLLNS